MQRNGRHGLPLIETINSKIRLIDVEKRQRFIGIRKERFILKRYHIYIIYLVLYVMLCKKKQYELRALYFVEVFGF